MFLKTQTQLERGADLSWLSVFPGEAETLFPPLTFMKVYAFKTCVRARTFSFIFKMKLNFQKRNEFSSACEHTLTLTPAPS